MLLQPASLMLLALPLALAAATYRTSSDDFPNPERGFYVIKGYDPKKSPSPLNPAQLRAARHRGISLVHLDWLLSEFRDKPLSSAILGRIHADFAAARDAGLKVIGRFLYSSGPEDAPDAPLDRVLAHVDQLRPVLRENSDVLALLEAGFIGNWGEWHDSTNGLLDHAPEIVAKLLDVLPPDRMLALRHPRLKSRFIRSGAADPSGNL